MIGGGTIPRTGEVSLAHGGVLFLDELPGFRRNALEAWVRRLLFGEYSKNPLDRVPLLNHAIKDSEPS